jgi:hypothetical protein
MISPIEVSHNNVINRLRIIKLATNAINKLTPDLDGQLEMMRSIINIDLADCASAYMLGVSTHMINYYENKSNVLDDYWVFIHNKNIIGLMDGCVRRINSILQNLSELYNKDMIYDIGRILNHENDYKMQMVVHSVPSNDCTCGGLMIAYSETSEHKCNKCGITRKINGVIFDDAHMFSHDGQKPKPGRHYPSLHCKLWMTRIQAWMGPEIPQPVFEKIQKCLKRDNIHLKKLRCKQVRKYLKECGYSTYNNFVPYIRKMLTGITPPQLTPDELSNLYSFFDKVVAVLKIIRPKNNITYYPYIIYKILCSILNNGVRKARILECIHLQSIDTMQFIDDIYKQVCEEIGELKHQFTDKHEYDFLL